MFNSVAAKNIHPVVAACVEYQIKLLITASFSDGIMEKFYMSSQEVVLLLSSI